MQPKQELSVNKMSRSTWQIDLGSSSVKFSVKKLWFITVTGQLTNVEGSIVFDEANLAESSVNATVDVNSINTGNEQRDSSLRSATFLKTKSYPTVQFQSNEVSRGIDRDTFNVKGSLKIKDTSKEVTIVVTEVDRSKAPDGTEVIYYVGETELNRFDFGVNGWRGVVGSKLKVVIDVQANRQS